MKQRVIHATPGRVIEIRARGLVVVRVLVTNDDDGSQNVAIDHAATGIAGYRWDEQAANLIDGAIQEAQQ